MVLPARNARREFWIARSAKTSHRGMKNIFATVERLHAWFVRVVSSLQSPLLLVIRVYWGWQFAQNGWGKLHSLDKVTDFFTSLNLPAPHATAVFVSGFEFTAGILLALGLLSRITALGIFIDMLVAYLTADHDSFVLFFSDPDKFTGAAPFLYFFVALLILIFGPGFISLDTLFKWLMRKRASPSSAATR
jgi:putative oxidoreductase